MGSCEVRIATALFLLLGPLQWTVVMAQDHKSDEELVP